MSSYFSEVLERYMIISRHKKGGLTTYSDKAAFGDVLEIETDNDFVVGVCTGKDRALLMSEFYELAGPKDIIVDFKHILGDTWIVETDRPINLSRSFGFRVAGKLTGEDITIIKSVMEGNPIPRDRRGLSFPPDNPLYPQNVFKTQEKRKLGSLFSTSE